MRVAVLGATRGMGREVARRLAERGDTLVVLARDAGAGEAMATDLRIRGARDTAFVPCDLADP
ncbi:MAG: SDR family NAD(P)-dependent oxidoreductase, partial [Myxococcales bacterium]|nr:SDR family NAD(P)-dependent oxidoreductase [Myxococcales bacterium]